MRYKKQGTNGTYRLRLPLLDGGLNADADATAIEDHELADVCNLRVHNGVLATRPALIGHEGCSRTDLGLPRREDGVLRNTADYITRQPFAVDGEMCVAMITARSYANGPMYAADSRVVMVSMDGDVKASYTVPAMDPQAKGGMVLIPVDAEKYDVPFLVYHYGEVFRPHGDILEPIPREELYAPLVMINGKGAPGGCAKANGVMFEGFNALTEYYRAQFTTNVGTGNVRETFKMPTALQTGSAVTLEITAADGVYTATATVGGEEAVILNPDKTAMEGRTVTANADGDITVHGPFDKSDIANNVTVTAKAANGAARMGSPSCGAWFGGTNNRFGGTRVFLAGFADGNRAKLIWSDRNNPLYFPENNYLFVGDLSQSITAIDKQEDMLVIFKERETYYTTYVQGDIDEQAVVEGTNVDVTTVQAYFPLTQLSPHIGCNCPHTVVSCRDRLVWMCGDGRVYTLASANQYSERNVREIGQKIRPRLLEDTTEAVRRRAYAADYDGEYWLLCGHTVYAFGYGAKGFVNVNSYASANNASKAIAWFVHRFDGITETAKTAIVSDGDRRALVIRTATGYDNEEGQLYNDVRYIHTLGNGAADTPLSDNGQAVVAVETPIHVVLRTKTYTPGQTAFCRLKGLWLTAKARGLMLSVIADNRQTTLPVRLDSEELHTHFVPLPIARCHRLALCLETKQPLMLSETEWHYTPFGYVK